MSQIAILVEEQEQQTVRSGTLGGRSGQSKSTIKSMSTEKLRESITALSEEFTTIMQDAKKVGGFKLKEVKIQAGIDAKAGIVLIGQAGIKGSVTLTFSEE